LLNIFYNCHLSKLI